MEAINSKEVLGDVKASLGEAPKHTMEGHDRCAYYVDPSIDRRPMCPHGMAASGAFYSEDYVNEMRRSMHQFITSVRASNLPISGTMKTLLHKVIDLTR
jgi:hypothetical protein